MSNLLLKFGICGRTPPLTVLLSKALLTMVEALVYTATVVVVSFACAQLPLPLKFVPTDGKTVNTASHRSVGLGLQSASVAEQATCVLHKLFRRR